MMLSIGGDANARFSRWRPRQRIKKSNLTLMPII